MLFNFVFLSGVSGGTFASLEAAAANVAPRTDVAGEACTWAAAVQEWECVDGVDDEASENDHVVIHCWLAVLLGSTVTDVNTSLSVSGCVDLSSEADVWATALDVMVQASGVQSACLVSAWKWVADELVAFTEIVLDDVVFDLEVLACHLPVITLQNQRADVLWAAEAPCAVVDGTA